VALVTGGGRGIGAAVARALARDGHRVAVASRTSAELDSVVRAITADGGEAIGVVTDVTNVADASALVEACTRRWGPPSILVNSAGAAESHAFKDHPDALWHRMLAVNLTGPYLVTKAAAPAMLAAGWGRVVMLGSVASLTGARYIAAYTAAKHGLLGLTRALAAEWARSGVTVNLVAPGYVDTPLTDGTIAAIAARTGRTAEEARSAVEALSPQRRLVAIEEVVLVVRLLVSDEAASITGVALPIDAGASALAATG
jgi:NAD(P)-dependent dehydrogenase (short-subunit alcohol dehydrogenase family)